MASSRAPITIKAPDDFRVESVHVGITDGQGILLEKGPATAYRLKPFIWKYKTTVLNTAMSGTIVKVTAKDYANNEVSVSCGPTGNLEPETASAK